MGAGYATEIEQPEPPHVPSLDPKEAVLLGPNRSFSTPRPLLTLAVVCLLIPCAGFAQVLNDDVHINPSLPASPPVASSGVVDASLKTHTKPIKVDVNLVLVPVTITDPMNRLVTGLDKENFSIFEGKEVQDIRHFSSEDAP